MITLEGTYNKAQIKGNTLYSYSTPICIVKDKKVGFLNDFKNYLLKNGYSATTQRHINLFLKEKDLPEMNKGEVLERMDLVGEGKKKIIRKQ